MLLALCARPHALFRHYSRADIYANSSAREHVDERVDAEEIDFSPYQIAYVRLADLEQFRGLCLRESPFVEHPPHRRHESRPNAKVLGLILIKRKIGEHISTRLPQLRASSGRCRLVHNQLDVAISFMTRLRDGKSRSTFPHMSSG